MGIGQGKGRTRAADAALAAISSPLLDFPIAKAKGIIFNIVGGQDMTLQEIADQSGENLKTIISRKGYAVKHLRGRLNNLYNDFIKY